MLPHMREPKTCTEMATEKPTLPAPEEQVSPAAEDAQANPAVTARVPEPEMPAAGPAAEASAAAEEPVAEVADAPAESAVTKTPAAETPAEEAAAERISGEEAAPRAKRARIKPAAGPEVAESEEDASRDVQVDFADEEAALAAQNAGLEIEGATPEEEAAEELAAQKPEEDKFAGKGKEELVALFARMLEEQPVQSIRRDVEALKIAFYRIRRAEVEAARRRFVEEGGAEEDFAPSVDGAEIQLKEQFKEYRRRRDAFIANLEAEKEANLKVKQAIIEELKELVNSDETLNHTFNKFRELQQRWKDTGIVPQQHVKDLWETYNLHVENFYSFIKINKELRDLDLKKNYEQKVALCEQAEALVLEPSVVEAFHKLQKLHDQWRETGPVANEYKEQLWERFREASAKVNKRHQEYFNSIKEEQKRNLELKTELCVKTEELVAAPLSTRKEWNKASDQLIEIQKVWKTIGFAPKKDNTKVYERFRNACDKFFENKRNFYLQIKAEMENNLHLKNDICAAAEALQESSEWKKVTDELIALQKRWKEIGPVSRRYSDAVWKRFRSACDKFFERKTAFFSSLDSQYEENLSKKRQLLDELKSFAAEGKEIGFETLKELQRRWAEIGFVPIKQKEAIQKEYRKAVDAIFAKLRGNEKEHRMERFKGKISSLAEGGDRRLRYERERLYNKMKQLEADIALLENNIGFFSKSKNAEGMIREVNNKITRAKEEMASLIEKIDLIDKQNN